LIRKTGRYRGRQIPTGANATKISASCARLSRRSTVENLDAVVEIVGDENLVSVNVECAVERQTQLLEMIALRNKYYHAPWLIARKNGMCARYNSEIYMKPKCAAL